MEKRENRERRGTGKKRYRREERGREVKGRGGKMMG